MPVLTPGKPFRSPTPTLLVENQLPVGDHRFQLTVVDTAQLESKPTILVVRVVQRQAGPNSPTVVVER